MEKHIERFECNCDKCQKIMINGNLEDMNLEKLIMGTNVKVTGEFYQMRKKFEDNTVSLNDINISTLEILPSNAD